MSEDARKYKAYRNSKDIQTRIIQLLKSNQKGLGYGEIYRRLVESKGLKSHSMLSDNLKSLMHKGLVKKDKTGGRGFGGSIYTWTGEELGEEQRQLIPNIEMELTGLPYVISAVFDRGTLKRVHIESGKKEEFCKAVEMINSISEFSRPVTKKMAPSERQFFAELLIRFSKLLLVQTSLLRDDNPIDEDAKWLTYLSLVVSDIESLFMDYSLHVSKDHPEGAIETINALSNKFSKISDAIFCDKIDLNRVRIYERNLGETSIGLSQTGGIETKS